jgi:hypothetical protein
LIIAPEGASGGNLLYLLEAYELDTAMRELS